MSQQISYRVDHEDGTGWPIIVRINANGSTTSQVATADGHGQLRAEFDAWNATQVPPLVVEIAIPTPPSTPFGDYAQPFVANAALWVRIHKALDDVRATFVLNPAPTAATILANNRAQVSALVAVIVTAPQGVIDAFIQERILEGSTTPEPLNAAAIASMTVAECRIIINMCQKAANKGIAIAVAANMPLD